MTAPLTILHAPTHGPSLDLDAIRFAASLDPDSIGWTEAYRRIGALRTRLRYRTRVGNPLGVPNASIRGAHDVPIQVRRRWRRRRRLVDWYAFKACDPSSPIKIAPDRWITGVIYDHPIGRVEHIALHPNAAVQGVSIEVDRVQKFRHQMRRLESTIVLAQRRGHVVIVTGDLNWGRPDADDPPFAPWRVFERCELTQWRVGLDWIAYAPHLRIAERQTFGAAMTGSDHPWMLARFAL